MSNEYFTTLNKALEQVIYRYEIQPRDHIDLPRDVWEKLKLHIPVTGFPTEGIVAGRVLLGPHDLGVFPRLRRAGADSGEALNLLVDQFSCLRGSEEAAQHRAHRQMGEALIESIRDTQLKGELPAQLSLPPSVFTKAYPALMATEGQSKYHVPVSMGWAEDDYPRYREQGSQVWRHAYFAPRALWGRNILRTDAGDQALNRLVDRLEAQNGYTPHEILLPKDVWDRVMVVPGDAPMRGGTIHIFPWTSSPTVNHRRRGEPPMRVSDDMCDGILQTETETMNNLLKAAMTDPIKAAMADTKRLLSYQYAQQDTESFRRYIYGESPQKTIGSLRAQLIHVERERDGLLAEVDALRAQDKQRHAEYFNLRAALQGAEDARATAEAEVRQLTEMYHKVSDEKTKESVAHQQHVDNLKHMLNVVRDDRHATWLYACALEKRLDVARKALK